VKAAPPAPSPAPVVQPLPLALASQTCVPIKGVRFASCGTRVLAGAGYGDGGG
jgi:hypothetical protein